MITLIIFLSLIPIIFSATYLGLKFISISKKKRRHEKN